MLFFIQKFIYLNFFFNCLFFNFLNYFYIYLNYSFYYIGLFFFNKKFIFNFYIFSYYFFLVLNFFFFSLNSLNFFFIEFFLDGLYYRIKYYKNYNSLGFLLGFNHYIFFKLPFSIKCKVHMKKRRFFLYSFDFKLLSLISTKLVNLKFPNLYKGKGVKVLFLSYRKKQIQKKK
jgi:hypothetical protein